MGNSALAWAGFGFSRRALYCALVALEKELLERVEEREKRVQTMTAEECGLAASMLRQTKAVGD